MRVALRRALLADAARVLEAAGVASPGPDAATLLAHVLGTSRAALVMVEEVAEHLYAIDRLMFHVTQHLAREQAIRGIRLGAVTHVPENDRPFGAGAETIVRDWCARSGIVYLGHAEIGHTSSNRIVPFGPVEAGVVEPMPPA